MTNNLRRLRRAATAIAAAGLFSAAANAQSGDFKWPRLLVIGTPGTATGSFASTNGWAPILQKEEGVTVRIVPEDSETMRFRRLTERKEFAIASVSAAEMRFQTQGIGGYASLQPAAQRILWHHNDTPWSFVVRGDSNVKAFEDLKRGGVRLAKGLFSPAMTTAVDLAVPAYLGLTPAKARETIVYVPASSYVENCRSVVEGKTDVAYCSPISSVLSEMEGAPGSIRWLDMPASNKEGWDAFLSNRPMLVPATIEIGVSTARGVEGATSNYPYSVPADANEEFVYRMAKWLHGSFDKYKDTHPLAARMSLEQFRKYLDRTPMPVHEGTVRYLREIGKWDAKDDARNQSAVKRMDAWIAAREAALADARKNGIDISFNNEPFLRILKKHTEGLEGFKSLL